MGHIEITIWLFFVSNNDNDNDSFEIALFYILGNFIKMLFVFVVNSYILSAIFVLYFCFKPTNFVKEKKL